VDRWEEKRGQEGGGEAVQMTEHSVYFDCATPHAVVWTAESKRVLLLSFS
jgi:hypothetical protein